MSVVSIASSRAASVTEPEDLFRLAVAVSGRLARAHGLDIDSAIAEALGRMAIAAHVDRCRLFEFTESGTLARTHLAKFTPAEGDDDASTNEAWLVDRLTRNQVVEIASVDDLPPEATAERRPGLPGPSSILGLPVVMDGQVACALVVDCARTDRRWPASLVGRLRLLSEVLGSALQRGRHETALHADLAAIERLNARLAADNMYLKEEIQSHHDFDDIVGESAPLQLALARVAQVASTNSTVLLLGPTGTGKELFARAVHERSRRHARPLVRVNCAALPPTLVESELFGHEKGAFTGAVGTRQGRFELADGGTIFLDEIGDLSLDVQMKFLRVLQEGEFERVGSSRTRRVDVRVIAATHRDLEMAIAEGTFRSDLYYRLSVYPIRLPALKERVEDIPRLVWFFIHRDQRELGRRITAVPPAVIDALQRQSWPGNVRELENVVERAMIATTGETLQLDAPVSFNQTTVRDVAMTDDLDAVQRTHIEAVLERCGWRINGCGNAAERLGIHPNTLRFRMKKLGVMSPRDRARMQPAAPQARKTSAPGERPSLPRDPRRSAAT